MSDKLKDKLFGNSKNKGIVTIIIPILLSISSGFALSVESSAWKIALWIITVILFGILSFFVYQSGKYDDEQITDLKICKEKNDILQNDLEQTRNKFDTLSSVHKEINELLHDYGNSLHKIVKDQKGHTEIDNWKEVKANCDDICKCAYNLLSNISLQGTEFSVSIIFQRDNNGTKEFNMLSRKAYAGHTPRLYNNFIKADEFEDYYFKRLFDRVKTRPDYLYTKEMIQTAFANLSDINYSQYIGIPISCTGNKMIALMQIISYNDSIIAKDKTEMEKLYNEYFCVFPNLVLLADKIENTEKLVDELK